MLGKSSAVQYNNSDTLFAEPIVGRTFADVVVGNSANRAQRRRTKAANRMQSNIYQHLDSTAQTRASMVEDVHCPPEIILPEPITGWDAAIRAADDRRNRELRTEAKAIQEDKITPLDRQFKPGKARQGAESHKLHQQNDARDELRGLQETYRQKNLTQLHKTVFDSSAARQQLKTNPDAVFNVPSLISDKPRRKGAKEKDECWTSRTNMSFKPRLI